MQEQVLEQESPPLELEQVLEQVLERVLEPVLEGQ